MVRNIYRYIFMLLLAITLSSSLALAYTNSEATEQSSAQTTSKTATLQQTLEQTTDSKEIITICENAVKNLDSASGLEKFETYLFCGIQLYEIDDYERSLTHLNSAFSYRNYTTNDEHLGKLYNYLGWITSANSDFNQAITYFTNASNSYQKSGNTVDQGNSLNSIGAMYWYQRNYAMALSYFNEVLNLGEESDNVELMLKALTNKGVVLNQLAQYNDALKCLEKALELNQLTNNKDSRASLMNNLGNIYYSLNKYDSAIRYYREALSIYTELKDVNGVSSCHNNIGEVFLKMGDINSALENYEISLRYERTEKDSADIAVTYVNIGRAHQFGKDYKLAISYFEKALKLLINYDDPALESETYLHLAQTVMSFDRYTQANDYLNRAIEIAQRINEKPILAQCYDTKSELYEQQQDFKNAFQYQKLYANLKDSITDEQALANSARMEAVYNLLQKEETISKLEQDNISKQEDLDKAKETRTLYLIISIALLACIIFLFLLIRLRRKSNQQLKVKNAELAQLNATKDKFFSIIAHDLKSPFSSLMGFAEMLCLHAESKNTKEVIDYSQVIHNSTKRLLGLVENLLQWSRTQLGTTEYKPMHIDVSIQSQNIVSLLRLSAEEKDIVISPKIEKDLVAWADQNLFSTVLRNLISNAIKFSRVGSVIYVVASKKNGMIEVAVSDSGVGIRQENVEKLFQVDSNFTTKGTFNEKGTGIGLVLCKEFVEINKGSIWAESELEKGSTFTFTLPLNGTN